MFSRRQRVVSVVFACVDAAATVLAFVSAYLVRSVLLPVLAAIVLIWLAVGYVLGVYRPQELRERRQAVFDPTKQIVAGMLVLAAGLFFVKGFYVSRLLLAGFVGLDWLLLVGLRLAYIEWGPGLRARLGDAHYILLIGTGPPARELGALIGQSPPAGLRLAGWGAPGG